MTVSILNALPSRATNNDEVTELCREGRDLKEVVAELTLENRLLKKRMCGPVCKDKIG